MERKRSRECLRQCVLSYMLSTSFDMRQRTLASRKAKDILDCTEQSMVSRLREVNLFHLALVRPHLEHLVPFWTSQYETDILSKRKMWS